MDRWPDLHLFDIIFFRTQDILEWQTSRQFFYWRLRRLLLEDTVKKKIQAANSELTDGQIQAMLRRWFVEAEGTVKVKEMLLHFFFFNETKRVLKFLLSPHGYITLGLFCWMFAHMWTGQVVVWHSLMSFWVSYSLDAARCHLSCTAAADRRPCSAIYTQRVDSSAGSRCPQGSGGEIQGEAGEWHPEEKLDKHS